ncbi:MAG: hypothetical protein HQ509_05235 [Candidatus Marinimicrobia bacterium]|nr:hypothetical protein [Candidatus Neomarinimicrobiota bacterium]
MSDSLIGHDTQILEIFVNMDGHLEEFVLSDSLYIIHLTPKGEISELEHRSLGNMVYKYITSGHHNRLLQGTTILEYDQYYRLSKIGNFKIKYDLIYENTIEKIGDFNLYYIRVGERNGEIEYINDLVIHKKFLTNKLDYIGDATFYYRITDDKIEDIRGKISGDIRYLIRISVKKEDLFEKQ